MGRTWNVHVGITGDNMTGDYKPTGRRVRERLKRRLKEYSEAGTLRCLFRQNIKFL
jgi:hypothetical protein